jgi:hypothetical protein
LIYNTCLPHFSLYWKTYALLKPPKTGGFTDKGLSLKIEQIFGKFLEDNSNRLKED